MIMGLDGGIMMPIVPPEEAAAAAEYRAQNPTGDDLLKLIYDEMRMQNGKEPIFKK